MNVVVSVEKELKSSIEKSKKMRVCPVCGSSGILRQFEEGDRPSKDGLFQPGCFQGTHIMDFVRTKDECIDFWNYRKHF